MNRRSLLLGTALASTLVIVTVSAPRPAQAAFDCLVGPPPAPAAPGPINQPNINDDILCVNTETRKATNANENAINLTTSATPNQGGFIRVNNEGRLTAADGKGIVAYTYNDGQRVRVVNTGDINVSRRGIVARTVGANSPLSIFNAGSVSGAGSYGGVDGRTRGNNSDLTITNLGDITLDQGPGVGGYTYGFGSVMSLHNSGDIRVSNVPTNTYFTNGIFARSVGANSPVGIVNSGDITASATAPTVPAFRPVSYAYGINAYGFGINSPISITNSAAVTAQAIGTAGSGYGYTASIATGINAYSYANNSSIQITNSGSLTANATVASTPGYGRYASAFGIYAYTGGNAAPISITSSGPIVVKTQAAQGGPAAGYAVGINAYSYGNNSPVSITSTSSISIVGGDDVDGIYGRTYGLRSLILITNRGDMSIVATDDADGIDAEAAGPRSAVSVSNSGALTVTSTADDANGIEVTTFASSPFSSIFVHNTGALTITAADDADGIDTETYGNNSPTTLFNTGALTVTAGDGPGTGIESSAAGNNSPISITNTGPITVATTGTSGYAYGINAVTGGNNNAIAINNSGRTTVRASYQAVGIQALSLGPYGPYGPPYSNSPISITNSGDVRAEVTGSPGGNLNYAIGLLAFSLTRNSPTTINNFGSVYAKGGPRNVGVYSYSYYANKTTIRNTGEIGAQSHFAIDVKGAGTADIFNKGLITGFVDLTNQNDMFANQAGGLFDTRKTTLFRGGNDVFSNAGSVRMGPGSSISFGSGADGFLNQAGGVLQLGNGATIDFGAGGDLFENRSGATVLAATNGSARETSSFWGLESFKNGGLISMQDGGVGDRFTIANTSGSTNLSFQGQSGSRLAVDAFLGGPGSKADTFTVQGSVSGTTTVAVNDTNSGPGVFNGQGIRVVSVTGTTPREGNFVLEGGPVRKGLFDYDLFFTPTGSGFWSLKSFANGSAHTLPGLLTAAQDLWHQTSATWFDRTADLRVVLNGGGAPAYDVGTMPSGEPGSNGLTPGAWIKGGGSWLGRDGSATTSAFGRSYTYDLDNELETLDLQVGLDMGQYDVLAEGDALIFGILGGFVGGNLSYDALVNSFDFSGGQVGAYVTYLNGGLFVDTLLNVHLYEIDTPNIGFPDSLDATTVGLRTDTGYRFGSFTGGAFFEPLATIEVAWADIDGFSEAGNKVSFSDDANVRGRLGARAGTTMQAWEGTMMEPFVIASLWRNLTDDNQATLVSSGTTFRFQDELQDVWGEVSAGVNLFNFTETTAVFAKVDYTFGEDISGVGGKAGMRVSW